MIFCKFIFVILVYRNTEDVIDCLNSIQEKVADYKVIIVNSYYDDYTQKKFKEIAEKYQCDFINVPNKGYGYGNNCGMKYAKEKYAFEYLVVSNPDIVIKKFDETVLDVLNGYDVYAPIIRNKNGKHQNPYWTSEIKCAEQLIYEGQKRKRRIILYSGYLIHKIVRVLTLRQFLNSSKNTITIFAAHGSFCVLNKKLIDKMSKVYDENMFLFAEEAYLAHELKRMKCKVALTKAIEIYHKEDGSMKLSKIDENDIERQSVIYYYETYVRGKKS